LIRGWAALATVAVTFPALDIVQRVAIAPWSRRRGYPDQEVLTRWKGTLADLSLGVVRGIGGATIRDLPRIPGHAGTLIVMNHQSLLDIPLLVKSVTHGYPRFVTRRRYAKGVPLISHMLRLYGHPLVDPGRGTAEQLTELAETARTSEQPIAIFPEGTRTRDGRIGRFQRAGLRAMLGARDWDVYVLVGDGMWQCARIDDFVHTISSVEVRMLAEGPLRFTPARDAADAFIDDLRTRMVAGLERLRVPESSPS
jgi:1-acyl-sn-glycerol-3-phosphate acyltransferase